MKKRILKYCLLIILPALFFECFVFNFRYWESMTFNKVSDYKVEYGGLEQIEGNRYNVVDPDNVFIELTEIYAPVKNVFIDLFSEQNYPIGRDINVRLEATDAGNALYFWLESTEVANGITESYYIRTHLVGDSEKIKIHIYNIKDSNLCISGLGINEVRPFIFLKSRFALLAVLILLFLLFRPGSGLYRTKIEASDKWQRALIIFIVALNVGAVAVVGRIFYDANWLKDDWKANFQYNYLAESLKEGHAYLDFEAPPIMETMENPYDEHLRLNLLYDNNQMQITDFAYYKGKYYSYFGIVPVILFHLPWLLITGKGLNTCLLTLVFACLLVLACFWFLYELIKKYFKNTSIGLFLLMGTVFATASSVLYAAQFPTIYSLPITMSLFLDLMGLSFWLRATAPNGKLRKGMLLAGAICIALVIGCRTQLAIVLLFAFPIFWKQIRERQFFTLKSIGNTMSVIGPFLVVGLGVMYYNYIRFSNPLDFGATYNLTSLDMTHRGFIFDRFVLGYYEYLFQPIHIGAKFPYFTTVAGHSGLATPVPSDYQGQVANEPLLAGFFAFNAIGVFMLGAFRCRKKLKERRLWIFTCMSILFGILISAIDIQMVGITLRYLMDFSVFFMIAAVIVILCLLEGNIDNENKQFILDTVCLLSILCLLANYCTLIAVGRYNYLYNINPYMFYKIKYQLCTLLSIR